MLLVTLFSCLLTFAVAEDFDELTFLKFSAFDIAVQEMRKVVKIAREINGTIHDFDNGIYRDCDGTKKRGIYRRFPQWNFLKGSKVRTAYIHIDDMNVMGIQVFNDFANLHFRFQREDEDSDWKLIGVKNTSCHKDWFLEHYQYLVKDFEKIQTLYIDDNLEDLKEWFREDYWFTVCDSTPSKYFFHPYDERNRSTTVTLRNVVEFHKEEGGVLGFLTKLVPYYQLEVEVNDRTMQLEIDMKTRKFTKGREYECSGYDGIRVL